MFGVHFYVIRRNASSWVSAAQQVLKEYCGLQNPSQEQVRSTAFALQHANVDHLENDENAFAYDASTPEGVDHRWGYQLFWFFYSKVEIFVPNNICPERVAPVVQPAQPPQTNQPVANQPTQPVQTTTQPPQPTPQQPTLQVPQTTPVRPVPQQQIEIQQIREQLRQAIGSVNRVIGDLEATGSQQMRNIATGLKAKKNSAQQVLNNEQATLEQLRGTLQELNSARASAKKKLDEYLRNL